mgnify:FL=1
MSTIAIIGAMDEEVANIASALSDITVTEEAGVSVTRGAIETNKGTRVNVAATVAAWAPSISPPLRSISSTQTSLTP